MEIKPSHFLLMLLVMLFSFNDVWAQECDDAEKLMAIDRYFRIVPVKALINNMASKVTEKLPVTQRANFLRAIDENLDLKIIESTMRISMCKHFTKGEIKALNEFYSKPEGLSVMNKMGDYMSDVMPVLQSQIINATRETF